MTAKIKLFTIIVLVLTVFCVISCKNDDTKQNLGLNKELTEGVSSADSVVIKSAEVKLSEFYILLKESDFDSCIYFFKKELYSNNNKESLVKALEQRIISMGKPDNYKIIYNYIDYFQNKDTVYYFILRVFNEQGGMCYEKYGIENIDKKYVIGRYEYSPVPYIDTKIANDERSEIYQAINNIYKIINSKDYEKVLTIVDQSLINKQGEEKLMEMFQNQFKDYKKINQFVVNSVNAEIVSGAIYINMSLNVEDANKSIFKENIVLIDRAGTYYVTNYQRENANDKVNAAEVVLTDEQYGRFKKEFTVFYQNLSSNNIEVIMSKFDSSAFNKKSYSQIKDYIVSRINDYGIPVDTKKTEHLVRSVNDFVVVDFYMNVSNSKGTLTYEKLSIGYNEKTDFMILGYDYSPTPLK
ncbi:MAG: hypothetical protein PHH30_01110 [Bacteroidales bacterium]|nr:hypothetical protein [Bacteroidales bacterium]